jgi:hypothetical protein
MVIHSAPQLIFGRKNIPNKLYVSHSTPHFSRLDPAKFIWSTVEYDLDDHTEANIGTFYLENVPDAPFRLVATDNTNTMPAAFRYLPKDDQIGCIAHISLLIAKVCVTSEDAIEVKTNIEAAKRLVGHVKRTDLQSRLTKTLKQTVSTCFYTYREMIGSVIESWEELENVLDARNELNYLEDINKILLIQTSHVLKPLHSCGLELEQDSLRCTEFYFGKRSSSWRAVKTNKIWLLSRKLKQLEEKQSKPN